MGWSLRRETADQRTDSIIVAAGEFFLAVFIGRSGARGGLQNPRSAEFLPLADGQIAKGSE
jgi:hypothetical protein